VIGTVGISSKVSLERNGPAVCGPRDFFLWDLVLGVEDFLSLPALLCLLSFSGAVFRPFLLYDYDFSLPKKKEGGLGVRGRAREN
jgi:hypothetical protein